MRKVFPYLSKDGVETFKVRYKIDGRSGSTTFDTRDDAEQFNELIERWGIRRALEFIKQPTHPKRIATGPTVQECVETYIGLRPDEGTREAYRREAQGHIYPALGTTRIRKLTREDVQAWANEHTGATASIRHSIVILGASLKAAVERGTITTNPCTNIKVPRKPVNKDRAPLDPAYSREEVELIRKAMHADYQTFIEFLYESGCRIGEACALSPDDISMATNQVKIDKTYTKKPGTGYRIGTTKTEMSDRTIKVKQSTLEKLDLSGDILFPSANGTRIKSGNFNTYHWKRALEKSGLPRNRWGHPHDLRHAHATWLLDAGISLPAIQRRLGHASVTITLNMYGHPSTSSEDQILKALGG